MDRPDWEVHEGGRNDRWEQSYAWSGMLDLATVLLGNTGEAEELVAQVRRAFLELAREGEDCQMEEVEAAVRRLAEEKIEQDRLTLEHLDLSELTMLSRSEWRERELWDLAQAAAMDLIGYELDALEIADAVIGDLNREGRLAEEGVELEREVVERVVREVHRFRGEPEQPADLAWVEKVVRRHRDRTLPAVVTREPTTEKDWERERERLKGRFHEVMSLDCMGILVARQLMDSQSASGIVEGVMRDTRFPVSLKAFLDEVARRASAIRGIIKGGDKAEAEASK